MQRLLWWAHLGLSAVTLLAYASPYISPAHFWPASFAALAYPTLLVAHLALAGWWLYRRSWRWLLSLLIVVGGYDALLRHVGLPAQRDAEAHTLTVASYNMLGGRRVYHDDPDVLADRVASLLRCVDADVVAFEEYTALPELRRALDKAFAKTGLPHVRRSTVSYLALYSRYPILETQQLASYNAANGAMRCRVDVAGDTLDVVVAHLRSNQIAVDAEQLVADAAQANRRALWTVRTVARNYRRAARQRALDAEALARDLEALPYPTVVLGDLNDVPLSYTLGTLRRAGLRDAFRQNGSGLGVTYAGSLPGLRIDYVLASPELTPLSAEVVDCDFSDHEAVRAAFTWP